MCPVLFTVLKLTANKMTSTLQPMHQDTAVPVNYFLSTNGVEQAKIYILSVQYGQACVNEKKNT